MVWLRAALALAVAVGVGAALVSGGSSADPRTPSGPPGLPPPFLGTALVGGGGLTAAIDAYGDVVDLRRRPAGRALVGISAARLAAGSVPADTGIVPRVELAGGAVLPLWRADTVRQRYRPGTDVLVTTARFGGGRAGGVPIERGAPVGGATRVRIVYAAAEDSLACSTGASGGARVRLGAEDAQAGATLDCDDATARQAIRSAERADRRWLARARPLGRGARPRARPLGPGAPAWAVRIYRRSLLVLRALTDRRTGAVAAGARDDWAYVWPRDAAAAALAFAAAGYRAEARRTARFLLGLDLGAAARFDGDGAPIPGRAAQGDAAGWVAVAARAAGLGDGADPIPPAADVSLQAFTGDETPPAGGKTSSVGSAPDYQEKSAGEYLGNAIASAAAVGAWRKSRLYGDKSDTEHAGASIARRFGVTGALVRDARGPGSGVDSVAAWAVRPFTIPPLFAAARESLRQLISESGRFGIVPSADWPEDDPWTAPTAWSAWSLAALARRDERRQRGSAAAARRRAGLRAHRDRRDALALLADLRRAATPAGDLPERVDARTGVPRSTTPLAWSHAFAVLTLRELWPSG